MDYSSKDKIYATPLQSISDFRFDQSVAEVFPDMLQRSIPGYQSIVENIALLAHDYAQDNSHIYDLGCSLGSVSLAIRRQLNAQNCTIVGVDNSPAMIERCRLHIEAFKASTPVTLICDDLQNVPLSNASVVVMNFTLQFILPEQRQALISKIYQSLLPGGILILSEKIRHSQAESDALLVELHHQFKRRNGYSELEISQKRSALENIMRTDTLDAHQQRLTQAGFTQAFPWFQCFNFVSMLAVK